MVGTAETVPREREDGPAGSGRTAGTGRARPDRAPAGGGYAMVKRIVLRGLLDVNCYLYAEEETRHGFLIDPGAQGEALAEWIRKQGLTIEKILLTHGHFDHIGALEVLAGREGIPVWIHEAGRAWLEDPELNLSARLGKAVTFRGAQFFRDGDLIRLEADPGYALRVIHTPGHTPDSVLLYDEKQGFAFSGDTIFQGSRGNDAFPGGDGSRLLESIRGRVLALPGETVLYPGHGEATTVAAEAGLYRA